MAPTPRGSGASNPLARISSRPSAANIPHGILVRPTRSSTSSPQPTGKTCSPPAPRAGQVREGTHRAVNSPSPAGRVPASNANQYFQQASPRKSSGLSLIHWQIISLGCIFATLFVVAMIEVVKNQKNSPPGAADHGPALGTEKAETGTLPAQTAPAPSPARHALPELVIEPSVEKPRPSAAKPAPKPAAKPVPTQVPVRLVRQGPRPTAGRPTTQPPRPLLVPQVARKQPSACAQFGTAVNFVDSPSEAARLALKEHKLLFLLHVAGNFEDDKFT